MVIYFGPQRAGQLCWPAEGRQFITYPRRAGNLFWSQSADKLFSSADGRYIYFILACRWLVLYFSLQGTSILFWPALSKARNRFCPAEGGLIFGRQRTGILFLFAFSLA